ncbi:MAG: serine protein kinase RIO [Candidatus Hadarchaeales archaeon]
MTPGREAELLKKLEQRKFERLEKDSETFKLMEMVFDHSTLLTLYKLVNRGVMDIFYGVVSTGKEANIFCALDKNGNFVAVKIYRIATTDFKTKYRYVAADPRFHRIPKDERGIVFMWASREYKNLQRAHDAGVPVPAPIDYEKNILVMEFIGENGVPYPKMKDVPPKAPKKVFKQLCESLDILYNRAGLVHSDFSEYNVLLTPDPVIIDFSMATDIRNPMADHLLMRDIQNLVRYFKKTGIAVPEPIEIFNEIKSGRKSTPKLNLN